MFSRGYRPHWVIGGLTSLRLAPALVFCPPPPLPFCLSPYAAPRQTSWRGRRPWSCSAKKTSFLVLLQCLLAMLTWNSFHNIWHALYWIKLQHNIDLSISPIRTVNPFSTWRLRVAWMGGECAHEQHVRRTLTQTLTHTITAYTE